VRRGDIMVLLLPVILVVCSHSRWWCSGFFVISSRRQNPSRCFVRGGGFGTSSSSPKKTTKRARTTKQNGGGILDEMMLIASDDVEERQLDRFGLPRHPTEESVFPPLSSDIVRVPIVDDGVFDRTRILEATYYRYLGVNLDAFDDTGHSTFHHHNNDDDAATTTDDVGGDHEKSNDDDNIWSLRMRHVDPPIFTIDNFLSSNECDHLSSLINDDDDDDDDNNNDKLVERMSSPTFSSPATSISKRTSTTWFCRYTAVSAFLAKVRHLLPPSVNINQMEEPQIVRYEVGQEFTFHYDTIPGNICNTNGGQRIATIIVYLNDVRNGCGGGTIFRDLYMDQSQQQKQQQQQQLTITPKKGTAVLFYPAYCNTGKSDIRTLHGGEVVTNGGEKRIIQLWIHEREYEAGIPFNNCQADAIDLVDAQSKQLGLY